MKKKLTVLATTLVVGGGIVGEGTSVYAASTQTVDSLQSAETNNTKVSMYGQDGFKPNFGKDKAKAKAYSKLRYDKWKKNLSSNQVKELETFKESPNEINSHIKKAHGDIDKITDAKIKKKIESLDEMIKQPENKTEKKQTIYTHFDPSDLGYEKESDMTNEENPSKLESYKISNVLKHFKFGAINEFKTSDLTMSGGKKGQRFVAELELPVGTYVGHLGDGQTVVPSDYAIEIKTSSIPGHPDKPKIIVEDGKQVIKVKAKLVKKEEVIKKVVEEKKKLNQGLQALNLIEANESEFIKLDLQGMSTSYSVKNAQEAVEKLQTNKVFPTKLLKKGLSELKREGGITFTTDDIDSGGYFDPNRKVIVLKADATVANFDPDYTVARNLVHELGHVFDKKVFSVNSMTPLSANPKFKAIYNKEKNNISDINTNGDYAKLNASEFFAEVFKSMFSPDSKDRKAKEYHDAIRKEAPEAVKFIEEILKKNGYL
ncbi:anthrax toxin lethal factor-related metalloendopeptidase [Bacillus thuringiensis]|uniref:anthrax toxin lethal factor-related metalloendopeptidase n=1 Tax=Bacillus thuringiensis TaxID=1428 RepID=UPI0026E4080D|nr:ADP-ribosyltransferase [Bacillus thuringiensis]MDO6629415.1 ADP-ribosyltransferase [Bacillus thuringiensis]MDO6659766.1 ADP-ribosyltransferase [Bacillus thuringiensis]MDO6699510.1 ADP-ribosyltransferase [Bacillus thuringiensis]